MNDSFRPSLPDGLAVGSAGTESVPGIPILPQRDCIGFVTTDGYGFQWMSYSHG